MSGLFLRCSTRTEKAARGRAIAKADVNGCRWSRAALGPKTPESGFIQRTPVAGARGSF
jgi:hypothetical protein